MRWVNDKNGVTWKVLDENFKLESYTLDGIIKLVLLESLGTGVKKAVTKGVFKNEYHIFLGSI